MVAGSSSFYQVWSLVRRFDQPQKYKPFVSRCIVQGNLEIGSLREVDVKSGLPATTSTERLELLDDEEHILIVRIIGGDHRLRVLNNSHFFCFFLFFPLFFLIFNNLEISLLLSTLEHRFLSQWMIISMVENCLQTS